MSRYRASYGETHAVALNFAAPWGTSVPGATDGTAFTTPAGTLRGMVSVTAFSTVDTGIRVEFYMDGVLQGTMRLEPGHVVSSHTTLSPQIFGFMVSAGTHYLGLRTTAGASDANDYGSFFGVVTPA